MDGCDDRRGLSQPKLFYENKMKTVFEGVTKVTLVLGKKPTKNPH